MSRERAAKVRRSRAGRRIENGQKKQRQEEILEVRGHRRQERDAPLQARHRKKRQGWKRRQGEKPETGYRDRALEGAQERQKGTEETLNEPGWRRGMPVP